MQNIKKWVVFVILGCLLSGIGLTGHSQSIKAASNASSRISAAKGSGLFKNASGWYHQYVKKEYPSKYTSGKEVLGYYTRDWETDNLSQNSLKNNADRISSIATFSFSINSSGQVTGQVPTQALNTARENEIETYALIHNLTSAGFDKNLIHAVISNPETRTTAVNNIYNIVAKNDFDGVHVDFENIMPSDRSLYNAFLSQLSKKLKAEGFKFTLAVPAKTWDNTSDGWSGGFDYAFIGQIADRVTLMTYDEHWIGGASGPVASQPWVEKVVKYAIANIPKEKIMLGIGNYGYDWVVGEGGYKSVPTYSAFALADKHGAQIVWDTASQTPYFYYWLNGKKHVVWFESPHSAAFKLDLVNQYDLKGIAIWRLGFETKEFWDKVNEKFN